MNRDLLVPISLLKYDKAMASVYAVWLAHPLVEVISDNTKQCELEAGNMVMVKERAIAAGEEHYDREVETPRCDLVPSLPCDCSAPLAAGLG